MDIPKGDKLDVILAAYGGIKQKSLYEKVRNFQQRTNDKTLLIQLIERASDQQIKKIKKYIEALAGWRNLST